MGKAGDLEYSMLKAVILYEQIVKMLTFDGEDAITAGLVAVQLLRNVIGMSGLTTSGVLLLLESDQLSPKMVQEAFDVRQPV